MNLKLLLFMLPVAVVAIACAGNAGATDPSGTTAPNNSVATTEPGRVTGLDGTIATATAMPRPTTSLPSTTPTATPNPRATASPRPIVSAPAPVATATRQPTATPIRIDPFATPTPLWNPTATRVPTSTPIPAATSTAYIPPTITPASPGTEFEASLNYQYELPSGWSEVRTQSQLVLVDRSGKIIVNISEQQVEPWRFPTAIALGVALLPSQPNGWDEWSPIVKRPVKSDIVYEFRYGGLKDSQEYLNIIHWYMWGDVRIQVSVEVPTFDWNESPDVQRTVQDLLDGFEPHDGSSLFTSNEVLALLAPRMDERPSTIYARDEIARARYELTCAQIYQDLLEAPEYFGVGLWQMSAQTLSGTEAWRVYEPFGSVGALDSNNSVC